MLIKITRVCDSSLTGFNHERRSQKSKILLQNSDHKNMVVVFNSKDFQPLRSHTRLQNYGENRRKIIVHSVEPGASPPGPPSNILSWAVGVAVAIVIPFISYKWGPLLKSKDELQILKNIMTFYKVMAALQMAEDVAETVEKVAEKVEKVAEDIVDNIPKDTKLREVVDFVEKVAERAADEAGAIDDFIDKLQEEEEKALSKKEEEEKAESPVNSLKDEFKKPPEDSKEEKPNVGN